MSKGKQVKIQSVNTINDNLESFLNKYVYVKCYICFNQDIRDIQHVSTPEQPAYPVHSNASAINFDYKGVSDFSHSDISKIYRNNTIVIVGGTIVPHDGGTIQSYPSKIIATKIKFYDE